MRSYWIASILTTLMSMGLLVVNTGQYQMLAILNTRNVKLQNHSEILYKKLLDEEMFKVTLENLVNRAKKVVTDLDATLVTLNSEMEKKKTENDDCQAQQVKHFSPLSFSVSHFSICISALTRVYPHSICKNMQLQLQRTGNTDSSTAFHTLPNVNT